MVMKKYEAPVTFGEVMKCEVTLGGCRTLIRNQCRLVHNPYSDSASADLRCLAQGSPVRKFDVVRDEREPVTGPYCYRRDARRKVVEYNHSCGSKPAHRRC
jgi:hypothetical protein